MKLRPSCLLAALFSAPLAVVAQVTTKCNPLNATCPNDPALGTTHSWNFTSEPDSSLWIQKVRGVTYDPELGATFTVAKMGDSPTLQSNFYFFWGRTEMIMRCANGTGIISSMMWLSADLDEVDYEFKGTEPFTAATNYFGKGIEDFNNGGYHNSTTSLQDDFHNYTVDWTADYLSWYLDGQLIRTVLPKDANNSYTFPQTPMQFNIGIWAGGDPRLPEGTREWAGGTTDYSKGPYSMYVKSVSITDYSTGSKEYKWNGHSGMADSISIINGTSDAVDAINNVSDNSTSDLSPTVKTGIAVGAGAAALGAVGALAFYIVRQRQRGAAEAAAAEKIAEEARREDSDMAARGVNPDAFSAATGAEYNRLAAQDTEYHPVTASSNPFTDRAAGSPLYQDDSRTPMDAAPVAGDDAPGTPTRGTFGGDGYERVGGESPIQLQTRAPTEPHSTLDGGRF
ncbi:hypothetical protein TD95_004235 [Thielaviopsis punctulata]|uniref:chitinase n=1 Tax=Thielaviopsis punctulata TaxID=72032 RepID=A0A0F4Z7I1_9PEZI|nr:hypothetical protein TD95_004235 [Thielaviopsis punctulata]